MHDWNVTPSSVNADPCFTVAEMAPPFPFTHTHDIKESSLRVNEVTLSPISNTPPFPLVRLMLLMEEAANEREGVFEREKRGEDVRANECICVLSTLISPPMMLNGEEERE